MAEPTAPAAPTAPPAPELPPQTLPGFEGRTFDPVPGVPGAAPDLSDPLALAAECNAIASALEGQQEMVKSGSTTGAHADPAYLFGRAAHVLRRSCQFIRGLGKPTVMTAAPAPVTKNPGTTPGK